MLGQSRQTAFRLRFAALAAGRVLDCGAGRGTYFEAFGSSDVVSLDATFSQVKSAVGKRVCADALRLPFKNDVFDTIWACSLIHYLDADLRDYIGEWIRVTKPKGRIFIHTPNRDSPFKTLLKITGYKTWEQQEKVVRLYSAEELAAYGKVYGEVRFLPFLNCWLERFPGCGHTLMLVVET